MGAFNFMSHGTQDYFPTFLEDDFGAGHTTITIVAIIYNVGALIGGMYFGALSQRFGRRRTIILCAVCALPMRPGVSSLNLATAVAATLYALKAGRARW